MVEARRCCLFKENANFVVSVLFGLAFCIFIIATASPGEEVASLSVSTSGVDNDALERAITVLAFNIEVDVLHVEMGETEIRMREIFNDRFRPDTSRSDEEAENLEIEFNQLRAVLVEYEEKEQDLLEKLRSLGEERLRYRDREKSLAQ